MNWIGLALGLALHTLIDGVALAAAATERKADCAVRPLLASLPDGETKRSLAWARVVATMMANRAGTDLRKVRGNGRRMV